MTEQLPATPGRQALDDLRFELKQGDAYEQHLASRIEDGLDTQTEAWHAYLRREPGGRCLSYGGTMPDGPSATLAGIRERAHELTIDLPQEDHCGSVPCTGHDALRLVAALEAVLALADKWDSGLAGGSLHPHARALRAAIARELTGKEADDARPQ